MQLCPNRVPTFREALLFPPSHSPSIPHRWTNMQPVAKEVCGQVLAKFRWALRTHPHHTPLLFAGRTTSNKGSLLACCSIILTKKAMADVRGSYSLHSSLSLPSLTSWLKHRLNRRLNHIVSSYFMEKSEIRDERQSVWLFNDCCDFITEHLFKYYWHVIFSRYSKFYTQITTNCK